MVVFYAHISAFMILFIHWKTHKVSTKGPLTLTLHRQNKMSSLSSKEYIKRRPKVLGHLYSKQFDIAINHLGLDPKQYQTHSMRHV